MTISDAAHPQRLRMAAAVARMRGRGTGLARAAGRLMVLMDLLVPLLLLGGCAAGFGPGQGERESVVIGYGTSGPRTLLLRPVASARVSSPFGERPDTLGGGGSRMHRGIDFAAPIGTPVRAAGDGVVIMSGRAARMATTCVSATTTTMRPLTPI